MPDTTARREARRLVLEDVSRECMSACRKWQPFNSPHEGYAVILEELDELWQLVKAKAFDGPSAYHEAIQVAAMAVRFAAEFGRPTEADDA